MRHFADESDFAVGLALDDQDVGAIDRVLDRRELSGRALEEERERPPGFDVRQIEDGPGGVLEGLCPFAGDVVHREHAREGLPATDRRIALEKPGPAVASDGLVAELQEVGRRHDAQDLGAIDRTVGRARRRGPGQALGVRDLVAGIERGLILTAGQGRRRVRFGRGAPSMPTMVGQSLA